MFTTTWLLSTQISAAIHSSLVQTFCSCWAHYVAPAGQVSAVAAAAGGDLAVKMVCEIDAEKRLHCRRHHLMWPLAPSSLFSLTNDLTIGPWIDASQGDLYDVVDI